MSIVQKKVQVVAVSTKNKSWHSINGEEEGSSPREEYAGEAFNVNLLDYMTGDEFIHLMKMKTENNYNALWKASKSLAMQLKASKAILTLNSYMSMGKSKAEVFDKLVESMKFTLLANYVYIYEHNRENNTLQVTHSNNIAALNQGIPISKGMEGKLLRCHCISWTC